MSASTRWLLLVAGVVAGAVVLAVAIALATQRETSFPAGSPEEAVQLYLRAVADREAELALSFMSSDLVDRCGELPRDAIDYRGDRTFRATLLRTTLRNEKAEVVVELRETYGTPPFDGGESVWQQTFVLVQEQGEWRFTETPWPLWCPGPPLSPRGAAR